MTVSIFLPWPPAGLTAHAKGNRWAKIKATKDYRADAAWAAKAAGLVQQPGNVGARMVVTYNPPSQRGDVHNVHGRLKPAIDGIADVLGINDKLFRVAFPETFGPTVKGGQVVIDITLDTPQQ